VLGVSIASLLFVETWWVKVFASLVAALWIARLFVIGHDAAMAPTRPTRRSTNGSAECVPAVADAYSLWEIGHNLAHHGFTNLKAATMFGRLFALRFARLP